MFSSTRNQLLQQSKTMGKMVLLIVLNLLWLSCLFLVKIPSRVRSHQGHLAAGSKRSIEASVDGIVRNIHLIPGESVRADDVLLELETEMIDADLEIKKTLLAGLRTRIGQLELELEEERQGLNLLEQLGAANLAVASMDIEKTQSQLEYQSKKLAAEQQMGEHGLSPPLELDKQTMEVNMVQTSLGGLQRGLTRLERRSQLDSHDRAARVRILQRLVTRCRNDHDRQTAEMAKTIARRSKYRIRAVEDGLLAEVDLNIYPGVHLEEGQKIASILSGHELVVIADFDGSSAWSEIEPGMAAHVWFDGLGPTMPRKMDAELLSMTLLQAGGGVRVRLRLSEALPKRIFSYHGVPCQVELVFDEVTIATYLWESSRKALRGAAW